MYDTNEEAMGSIGDSLNELADADKHIAECVNDLYNATNLTRIYDDNIKKSSEEAELQLDRARQCLAQAEEIINLIKENIKVY